MKYFSLLILLLGISLHNKATEIEPLSFSGYIFDNNEHFEFKSFKGKVVYIDFWASWCAPCRESMPFLEKLYLKHRDEGFEIIAINIDEYKDDAKQFLSQQPISYQNLYDPDGKIGKLLKVKTMPTAFLVNRKGKLLFRHSGFNTKYSEKLASKINQLVSNNTIE